MGPAPPPRGLDRAGRRPDVRLRRGEDDHDVAPGLRAQGRRGRHLGAQLHDPQPDRRRRTAGLRHLGDRLGPGDSPSGAGIEPVKVRWLDVAGIPRVYPVFDAERGFDTNGDGKYVFPDEVPDDPAAPGFEERRKISPAHEWTVPDGGATLVGGAGHLHPGGLNVASRSPATGPTPGMSTATALGGAEAVPLRRPLLRAGRRRELGREHGGDEAGLADPPEGRRHGLDRHHLRRRAGVVVRVDGDPPGGRRRGRRPGGEGPVRGRRPRCEDVREGRHPHPPPPAREHRHSRARQDLGLPDPRDLRERGPRVPPGRRDRQLPLLARRLLGDSRLPHGADAPTGGRAAAERHLHQPGRAPGDAQTEQAWHTITSCKPPCNRGPGIGYPLADGPIKFDSGQLGLGSAPSSEVTTGSNVYTTPPLTKPGKTYTYFCRIHPFMRGSIRVAGKPRG